MLFEAQPRVLIRRALREGRGRKGHGASAQHHAPEAKQGNGLGGASLLVRCQIQSRLVSKGEKAATDWGFGSGQSHSGRSEERTSEPPSVMRPSSAVFRLK